MILFLEDYKKYPTYIIDTSTKNTSWLETSQLLRSMGVKNHAFPLVLINPALQGVDPHSPYLTMAEIQAIAYEVKINPWYYFREVARVPATSGLTNPPLRANRANIALFWLFFNHVLVILIQPRQTGKSINMDSLSTYLLQILCTNTKINLITKDDKLRRENIGRIKDIINTLPYYLNQTTRNDADNGEEITVLRLDNHFKTHVPQSNPQRALNSGRGMTTAIFLGDEIPFQSNVWISLPAALGSMGAALENARKNDDPHGIIFTTTAGKLDSPGGKFFYEKFVQEAAPFSDHFYDTKDQKDLHQMIRNASRVKAIEGDDSMPSVNCTFSHRQLGFDDNWLRRRIREARQEGDDAARDFLNRWTSGSAGSPFKQSVTDRISNSKCEILYREIDNVNKFVINWYVDEHTLTRYMTNNDVIVGMDSSEGTGRDFIGLVFLCARTGGVLGTSVINNILTYTLTEWLVRLITKYPRMLFIPERKSTAVTIIDGLLEILPGRGIDPFKRIFNWVVQEPDTHQDLYQDIKRPLSSRDPSVYVRAKRYFGYGTTGRGREARERLFGQTLTQASTRFAERTHDATLIQQLLGLEIKNNRIDHASGKHDDLVVSWLLAFWVLIDGRNLQHYGINPLETLSVPVVRSEVPKELRIHRQEQAKYREQISAKVEQISKEYDSFIIHKLESEIRQISRSLSLEDNEVFSVEELISRARDNRRMQRIAA